MASDSAYRQASIKTADNLRSVARSAALQEVSRLSLPEIDAVVDNISSAVPAGNVPGMILNGLARLSGSRSAEINVRRDVNLLFKGVESALDRAAFGALFAGPAALIWGYQNLLKLAGKDPETAFPEGLWQFYVEYALREDTARHALETHGFDTMLTRHQLTLSPVDRTTAWLMAAITLLHQYPELLANEWRERTFLSLLAAITTGQPDAAHYAGLYERWQRERPLRRNQDAAASEDFPAYRRRKFDTFLAKHTQSLHVNAYNAWTAAIAARRQALRDYKKQLSLHACLEPGSYGETRVPLPLSQLHVGLIVQGRYYLIPACAPDGKRAADVESVRELVSAVYALPTGGASVKLHRLATIKRGELATLRRSLNPALVTSLERLRQAPILFNADQRPADLALAEIRQAERGIGDHALTLFDAGQTFVFDQSPIFFDAAWGAAVSEIMTHEAMSWAVYLHQLPPQESSSRSIKPLPFPFESREHRFVEQSPRATAGVSVETDKVNVQLLHTTRKLFTQRNDLLRLTGDDLLILYRAVHAVTYQPDAALVAELNTMTRSARYRDGATQALEALAQVETSGPGTLIPVDATGNHPRERIYPMVFAVPLAELDLLELHGRCLQACNAYKAGGANRAAAYAEFDKLQRTYLATLAGFGQVMSVARAAGIRGEGARSHSLELLAKLPPPLQRLLDSFPNRFDLLHDQVKGRELFANLEQVTGDSILTRFSPGKDDSEKKRLAWGIITDAQGVMRITLRDFRPHVAALLDIGYKSVAVRLAQHYLDSYAAGFNAYLRDLRLITSASRETRIAS